MRQCWQWCCTCLLCAEIQGDKEGKAETKTLSLGCPNLWCQSCNLFLEDRNAWIEVDAGADDCGMEETNDDGRVWIGYNLFSLKPF